MLTVKVEGLRKQILKVEKRQIKSFNCESGGVLVGNLTGIYFFILFDMIRYYIKCYDTIG